LLFAESIFILTMPLGLNLHKHKETSLECGWIGRGGFKGINRQKEDHGMKRKMAVLAALAVSAALLAVGSLSFAQEAKRMTKEELKAMLDSPDLVVVDVRTGKDWTGSDQKIKGALREDPRKVDDWAARYDKEKTVVIYCAWPNEGTSASVALQLAKKGFANVYALKGGWKEWQSADLPTEPK
jgi:rhodanese-related sulfurtransferase